MNKKIIQITTADLNQPEATILGVKTYKSDDEFNAEITLGINNANLTASSQNAALAEMAKCLLGHRVHYSMDLTRTGSILKGLSPA